MDCADGGLRRRWLAAACVPWAGGLKRPVHLRRERRLRQSESPTRGLHQAQGCRPPVRVAASDQLSRSTGRALRSLCRSPTACRHVSASARAPSGPTGWSARSMPSAWSSSTSASSANRAAADLRASSHSWRRGRVASHDDHTMPSIPLEVKQNAPCPYFSTRLAPTSQAHTAGRGPRHPAGHADPAPPEVVRRGDRDTARWAGHVSGTSPLMPAFHAVGCATPGGAPLRGGASHEAEGRRGARPGRVRPPRGVACACCAR